MQQSKPSGTSIDSDPMESWVRSGRSPTWRIIRGGTTRQSTEWLPVYAELRYELIAEYNQMTKRRDEDALAGNKGAGHPTMALQGFEQPRPRPLTCYGCGQPGHRRGDPSCHAGPKEVWKGAPDQFKELMKRRSTEFQ